MTTLDSKVKGIFSLNTQIVYLDVALHSHSIITLRTYNTKHTYNFILLLCVHAINTCIATYINISSQVMKKQISCKLGDLGTTKHLYVKLDNWYFHLSLFISCTIITHQENDTIPTLGVVYWQHLAPILSHSSVVSMKLLICRTTLQGIISS